MKATGLTRYGWVACAVLTLLIAGCASTKSTILVDPRGDDQEVTQEDIAEMSGADTAYLTQVGDKLNIMFGVHNYREGEVPWDYRIEIGDQMEVRLTAPLGDRMDYKIDVGDLIGISFLNNWPLNSNRTVRPDGFITMPEVGDVKAAGLTATELNRKLTSLYAKTGIIEGDPRITVNVDFSNPDRLENMSRDVVVRPDGAIRIPGVEGDVHIAGLTVDEASKAIEAEAAKVLRNNPKVALIVFPYINNALANMNGVFTVRPDGRISVPKLGDVQVAGYSVEEIRKELNDEASEIIFNKVEVSVDLASATGSRIYVGGEVGVNGVYPLDGAPTALQAIMMAAGPNNNSRLNSVLVIRRNPNGKPYVFKTNLAKALQGHMENDIPLRAFDVVYVPKKIVSKANLFVQQYIDDIVPFDNSLGVTGTYYMNEQKINTKGKSKSFNSGVTLLPSSGTTIPIGGVVNP